MSLLEPQSIAVIGASADEGSVGHDILQNLLTQGYEGVVYPVNPKHKELQGQKAYASVKEIDGEVDLAIVVVPATIVPAVLQECTEKQIPNIVIISAGFSETHTKEGIALEEQIKAIASPATDPQPPTPNIIGPNCLGIVRPSIRMNASFAAALPPEGKVALISQSGATAVAMMDASSTLGIGYSFVASIGNKTIMDECDLLEIAMEDTQTHVIGLYLESIKDGRRFLRTALRCNKPIVLLKAGVSKKGSEAASSHTGALAGSTAGMKALCRQSGIVHAENLQEFLDLLEGIPTQPKLASTNIAIITNAGGPGILATDAAEHAGLRLPALEETIETELRTHLPAAASTHNPIDVIGDADAARFSAALDAAGKDPNIDGIALLLTPQVMTPVQEIAEELIAWKQRHPAMPVVSCLMGEEHIAKERLLMQEAGIPCYETPERALSVLGALKPVHDYGTWHELPDEKRAAQARDIIGTKSGLLTDDTVQQLCALYSIPLPEQKLATTKEEAIAIARDIGYPVVVKVSSPDIIHKTDVGGIKKDIQNDEELKDAFIQVTHPSPQLPNPSPRITGALIQQMLHPRDEFIVGTTRDASFGPLIMVGLGGIYTELLQDTSFRIAPINTEEAYRMLTELHAWQVLLGARGKKQLDIDGLAALIENISALASECPHISAIDLNPVFVDENTVIAADVKIVIA